MIKPGNYYFLLVFQSGLHNFVTRKQKNIEKRLYIHWEDVEEFRSAVSVLINPHGLGLKSWRKCHTERSMI